MQLLELLNLHDYEFCNGIAVKEKNPSAQSKEIKYGPTNMLTFIHFLNINKWGCRPTYKY